MIIIYFFHIYQFRQVIVIFELIILIILLWKLLLIPLLTIKFGKYLSKYQIIYFFAIDIKNYNLFETTFKSHQNQRRFSIFSINTNNNKKWNKIQNSCAYWRRYLYLYWTQNNWKICGKIFSIDNRALIHKHGETYKCT